MLISWSKSRGDKLMNEVLTIQEIEARYASEWILVEDPEVTPQLEVIGGKVLYHSKGRDEVYQKAIELRPKHSAYLYTGPVAEGVVMLWAFGLMRKCEEVNFSRWKTRPSDEET